MNDPLQRLSELSRLASPSHRNFHKKIKEEENAPIFRCPCGQPTNSDEMIFCSVCHCQFHIECIEDETDNPTWVCPYCLQESSQALLNKGIDLSILSQEIGNNKMTQVIANSYQDSANISELFEKSSAWVSAIISRDDVYFNLEDIVRSSVDEEGGMQLLSELSEERNLLKDLSNILQELSEETKEMNTPILGYLSEQIDMYHQPK